MDKEQKRKLKRAWEAQEREKLITSIPVSHSDLRDLFDFLDREGAPPCDHTLRETVQFLTERDLAIDTAVAWLQQHGGDCEVIFNVEDKFGEIVGRRT